MGIKILKGDCLETLKSLDEQSINTCVTSPPYWGLRDYGTGEWVGGDPDCPHMRTTKISKDTATGHKAMYEQGNVVGDAIYKSKCPKCGSVRKDKQLGLEETPEEFVENLVRVFKEVKRVLRDDGTVWLILVIVMLGLVEIVLKRVGTGMIEKTIQTQVITDMPKT
jgi:DNA modification methylase